MLKLIPKSPSFILTKQIHQRLLDEDFNVSKRTVERDLESLALLVGINATKDAEGFKWSYMSSASEFTPAIAPSEALLLCIAYRQMLDVLPFQCISNLEPRFLKAEQTLACNEKFKNWQDRVKIISFGFPLKAKAIDEKIRHTIYDTMLNGEQLAIEYQKDIDTEKYLLNTHGLIIREYVHYLVASKSESPDTFQLFKLSKIKQTTRSYTDNQPCNNDIKHYLNSNASGYLLADEPIKLELLATGPALAMFEEAVLSDDQSIKIINQSTTPVGNVKATVEFSHELIHFLLGFGQWIKVIPIPLIL